MRKIMIGLLGVSFTTVAFANSDRPETQPSSACLEKLIEHQMKLQFIHIRIINTIFLKKPFL